MARRACLPPPRRSAPPLARGPHALALGALLGCFPESPDLPDGRRPEGVRVLATRAEPPSGTPGAEVQLTLEVFDGAPLLAEAARARDNAGTANAPGADATFDAGAPGAGETLDASPGAAEMLDAGSPGPRGALDAGAGSSEPAPLSIAWLGGCHNPPGDSPAGCSSVLQQIAAALPDPLPPSSAGLPPELTDYFGTGSAFATRIPADILEGRRLPSAAPPFGVSFTFFAVCRGVLRPALDSSPLPLACHDRETDRRLGSEAFVTGFVTTYTYASGPNASPVLLAQRIDGAEMPVATCSSDADCAGVSIGELGTACGRPLTPPVTSEAELAPRRCLPVVAPCTLQSCRSLELLPELDPASVEQDPSAAAPGSPAPEEILWVKYFGFGGFSRDEALIHDRATGYNPDFALRWSAPPLPFESPVPVWAVVQDHRGGTAVGRWDFFVRE